MLMPLSRSRSIQLALFAHPHPRPDWRKLSPEVQQKILRLLTLLLRQHGARPDPVQAAEEARDE
jgi:hypothetical protein